MNAFQLYSKLEQDFIKPDIYDVDWAARMPEINEYLFPKFKENGGIGLMCDFTCVINKVYTTVFLSDKVLSEVLSKEMLDNNVKTLITC